MKAVIRFQWMMFLRHRMLLQTGGESTIRIMVRVWGLTPFGLQGRTGPYVALKIGTISPEEREIAMGGDMAKQRGSRSVPIPRAVG